MHNCAMLYDIASWVGGGGGGGVLTKYLGVFLAVISWDYRVLYDAMRYCS